MRLVCPNCDAEYEVDASAIPDTGRDVQCSNCGHAWFQLSPAMEEELASEEALFDPPPPPAAEVEDVIPDTPAPPPRALDESVLSVLREEAEREMAARRSDAPVIETQADLGLAAAPPAPAPAALPEAEEPLSPAAQRIARMKGMDPTPPKPQSRREMLPAIEEINSTLRASGEKRTGEAGTVSAAMDGKTRSAGFRNGFVLMMILAVMIAVLYVMAPRLAAQIPELAPALNGFVAAVDSARLALDGLVRSLTAMIGGAG